MSRPVIKVAETVDLANGHNSLTRHAIGSYELRRLDPLLMLGEFIVNCEEDGFPDHASRGFEAITYVLNGAVCHEDFAGNYGIVNKDCVQWMIAGRGIVHSEMPHGKLPLHALQLWFNSSAKDKMIAPEYQDLKNFEIPIATSDKVTVKIVAGESMGARSKLRTRTPLHFLDFQVQPGGSWRQRVTNGWTTVAYVLSGNIIFGNEIEVAAHHTAVFGNGEFVEFFNGSVAETARFVLISGCPIGEPVAQRGPFVMNTTEEIYQAMEDYSLAQNGFEAALYWRPKLSS